MPLIRYRTGDLGRMLPRGDETLHRTPLFELLGRRDDVLRVGAMSIYPDKIAEALGKVPGLTHLFQMEADYIDTKEKLTVRVEATQPEENYEELASRTRQALLDHDPELDLVVRENWLGALEVQVVAPGKLPRNPRTGKIRKVTDNRTRKGAGN